MDKFLNILKRLSICYIVDSDATMGISEVALSNRFETFLARSIPNL